MAIVSTRLRYISAVEASAISLAVSMLPFKVEIKGAAQWDGKRWYLWFIIPEHDGLDFANLDLA